MKKVGIITFSDSPNYGALLQTFATQRFLRNCGFDAEIIDYANKERGTSQVSGLRKVRSIIWNKTFYNLLKSKKREANTSEFITKNIKLSEDKYTSPEQLLRDTLKYDYYITGSDQVWNPRNNGKDSTYLLGFAPDNKVKISYAPSFGVGELTNEYIEFCKPFIESLNHVSIREDSGKEILKNKFNKKSEVVLDPTFLLDVEVWDSVATKPKYKEEYIFCYYMPGDKVVESKIEEISKYLSEKTGLKIINAGKKVYDRLKVWEDNDFNAGPSEFIGLIKNAKYVVTNSFHGTVFSVIYNKAFWVPVRTDLEKGKALNGRMINLLNKLQLEDRLYRVGQDEINNIKLDIDYKDANKLLNIEIEKSRKFLLEALEVKND